MKKVTVTLVLTDRFKEVQAEEYIDTVLNNTWAIHKAIDLNGELTKSKKWVVTDVKSGMEVFVGKTKQEVIDKLNNFINDNTRYMEDVLKHAKPLTERRMLREKREELKQLFEDVTKVTLNINKCGVVDVVKLDKDIKTPDGVSTSEHIKNTFGEDLDKVLDDLIELQFV